MKTAILKLICALVIFQFMLWCVPRIEYDPLKWLSFGILIGLQVSQITECMAGVLEQIRINRRKNH